MNRMRKLLGPPVGLLVLVGALAALMPLVGRGQGGNPLTRDPRKSFYMTDTNHDGGQAPSACAAGYHMASLWEIFDTSNLKYNTELGRTQDDSGSGPPSDFTGWIRTGVSAAGTVTPGIANCQAWTSTSGTHYGTAVGLSPLWDSSAESISPWYASSSTCNQSNPVWCVQD